MDPQQIKTMYLTAVTSNKEFSGTFDSISASISYSNEPGIQSEPKKIIVQNVFTKLNKGDINSYVIDFKEKDINVYTVQNITLTIQGRDAWLPQSISASIIRNDDFLIELVNIPNWSGPALSSDPSEGVEAQPIFPYAEGTKSI